MKKILILLILALLLCGCTEKVTIGGGEYPLNSKELDLSGQTLTDVTMLTQFTKLERLDLSNTGITPEQYDALRLALPDCNIRWTPIFQGQPQDPAATTLTVGQTLTAEDLAMLAYFPDLTRVDATACRDYAMLAELINTNPDLTVDYMVVLGGAELTPDAAEANFVDISGADLNTALSLLPGLKNVNLTGELPAMEQITAAREAYPAVDIRWEVEICGQMVACDIVELDLSGIVMEDVAEVEEKVVYLPQVQKVIMCDCGISNEEMDALNRRHDNISFVWNVTLGPYITVRTDLTQFIVYKYKYGYFLDDEAAYNLRYCTEMVCLDLGHHDLSNCDFVAFMPKLKYLVIAETDITDLTPLTGLTELIWLEIFLCPVENFEPLTTLTALEDLNIGYTECDDLDSIKQMTWLKRLWWGKCPLKKDQRAELIAALPNTEIAINRSESSTGAGWRLGQNYFDMRDMLGMHYMSG